MRTIGNLNLSGRGASRPAHPCETTLRSSPTPEQLECASNALAPFLARLCQRPLDELARQLWHFEMLGLGCDAGDADFELARLEREDVRCLLSQLRSIAADAQPHARHMVEELAVLARSVPFESITITGESVTIRVASLAGSNPAAVVPSFEIGLLPPDSPQSPIRIVTVPGSTEQRHLAFAPGAGHGLCRGGAEPLIESAMERVRLVELVLVAIGWARRNLQVTSEVGNDERSAGVARSG